MTTTRQWLHVRRPEVVELVQEMLLGRLPQGDSECMALPALLSASIINTTAHGLSSTSRFVNLTWGVRGALAQVNVSFAIELLVPSDGGVGAPIFLTQWTHRPWALVGLERGYVGVVYPGADCHVNGASPSMPCDAAPAFQAAYCAACGWCADSAWALILARAWVASRALDYVLQALPQADASRVCISGHSRNGKQSLVAAAFDERIGAVVGSSPGSPVASPFRFSSAQFYGQDAITSGAKAEWFSWWAPKSREFVGRENEMPMDGHGILGMIAPRAAAIATATEDREGDSVYANEMSVREARHVYALFGAEANISVLLHPGDHHGYTSVTSFFDYFDAALHRPAGLQQDAPSAARRAASEPESAQPPPPPPPPLPPPPPFVTPVGFDWEQWRRRSGASRADAPSEEDPLERRVAWVLDANSSTQMLAGFNMGDAYCEEASPAEYVRLLMNHEGPAVSSGANRNVTSLPFSFGTYVTASAFFDAELIRRRLDASSSSSPSPPLSSSPGGGGSGGEPGAPVVVWLHGYGYNRGFDTLGNNSAAFLDLAARGYVVLAFDMVGFGMRLREGGAAFYRRYPRGASLLGKMVADVRALVDTVHCLSSAGRADVACFHAGSWNPSPAALEKIPAVDPDRVLVAGYALGGLVALHAAALDPRIAGVASIAGFTPMRSDTASRPTGGLRRLAEMHALAPRLGLYVGDEAALPYDVSDLLEAAAPRPTLLVTPVHDRDATHADVLQCVARARAAWQRHGAAEKLQNTSPDDYTRISPAVAATLVAWADNVTSTVAPRPPVATRVRNK